MLHPRDAEYLEFDDANEEHLARHDVDPDEVHQVFLGSPLWVPNIKGHAAAWRMVGRSDGGRALIVSVLFDEARLSLRPVTARTCSTNEVSRWSI